MFRSQKTKPLSPLCTLAITTLSVVGAVSLAMMAKKKMGSMKQSMKKFGCECKDTMEDVMDKVCDCDEEEYSK